MGNFKIWLETITEEKAEGTDEKSLISFTGLIRPLIRKRLSEEFGKNVKEIVGDLTQNFSDAFYGVARSGNEAVTIWEFQLAPKPIPFKGQRLSLGSGVLAYQLPSLEDHTGKPKVTEPTEEEREKFRKGREKFFLEFLKGVLLSEKTLDDITDDIVQQIFRLVTIPEEFQGRSAKIVWSSAVTTNGGTRTLGRILFALRLKPFEEKQIEKAIEA